MTQGDKGPTGALWDPKVLQVQGTERCYWCQVQGDTGSHWCPRLNRRQRSNRCYWSQGDKGDTGAKDQGSVGNKGDTGAQGPKVLQVRLATKAMKGEIGPQGDTGLQGNAGATGDKGARCSGSTG